MNRRLKSSVFFLCDGGSQYGFGHISRSTALCEYFRLSKLSSTLFILSNLLDRSLPKSIRQSDMVVVDLPYDRNDLIRDCKQAGAFIVGLDYGSLECVDLNIDVFAQNQNRKSKCKKYMEGLQYIILRNEILSSQKKRRDFNAKQVTITIGGSDIRNRADELGVELCRRGRHVCVIHGPFSKAEVKPVHAKLYAEYRNPSNYVALLNDSGWLVTSGGGTMMEALYLGVPAWVMPQTEKEANLAAFILNKGALLGVGDEIVIPTLEKMQKVSARGKKLIDGYGKKRLLDIMTKCWGHE